MSLQNFNCHSHIIKRNYNQMLENSISGELNNDSFIKIQLFKSALKFGGPINQDLVIHHKKNVRKSLGYKIPKTITEEKNIEIKEEIDKKEANNDLCNSPKEKKSNLEEKKNIFSQNIFTNPNNNGDSNHFQFGNFYSARKENDNNKPKYFLFNTEKRIANYDNSLIKEKIKKEIKKENDELNKTIFQKIETKKEEKNENEIKEIKEENLNENNNINNPFLPNNNIQNKNEQNNPFHSSTNTNSFFIKNNNNKDIINNNINNVVENPFLAISKPKIENPFKIINPFISNNTNNDNSTINTSNTNNNNKIINPFISSNNNPFSSTSSSNETNQNKNQFKNPFNLDDYSYNPFLANISNISDNNNQNLNPFTSISNNSNNNNIMNPFINKPMNPFKNNNNANNDNPFIKSINTNDKNTKNHFLIPNNPFISNLSNTQNNQINQNNNNFFQNANDKEEEEEDGNYNVEEEIKIEKNEENLKKFKEVKYKINNKFYQIQIENLQYLGKENDKNKYFTIGPGMLSLEEDKDRNGKKRGIFVLRDLSVKNIKIQGIILSSSSVEKVQLTNGNEIIMFKNVFATFPKYNNESLSYETKLTYIRMRVKPEYLDVFFKKANEFFELMKK